MLGGEHLLKISKEDGMSGVRVLVGTRKGAFILTADGKRQHWDISGPHFAGWEVYHLKGSPVDPNRLYASQSSGWFGQLIQRSNDGGQTWEPVGNKFVYDGAPGTHMWYDGTPHPWEFKRVWHLEPSLTDPDTVYAGVEDAAFFRSTDGGQNWQEFPGLRGHDSGSRMAARSRRHVPAHDPLGPEQSRPHLHRHLRGRRLPDRRRRQDLAADQPRTEIEVPPGPQCRDRLLCPSPRGRTARVPRCCSCNLHWNVITAFDDAGDNWQLVSGNLPTDFGFVIDVHAHEPDTVYVVPIKSDSEHFVHEGKLRVFRSRTGGNEWEPLTNGLPQSNCYVNVLRDAMAVDALDSCGVYFGTTGGQVYASADAGDSWAPIVRRSAGRRIRGSADPGMIRVVLPYHLRTLAHVEGEVELAVAGSVTQRAVLDALEARFPMLRGTIRDHVTGQRRAFLRFFACEQDLSHERPDDPLPEAVASGAEASTIVIGAIAGGQAG